MFATGLSPAAAEEPGFSRIPPPSLNFYGSVGLIDMPSAEMTYDGNVATTASYFRNHLRTTLTFQATPWLSASFRYNGTSNLQGLTALGFVSGTLWDRNFDVRVRLLKEGRYMPGITVGLQDLAGTGRESAEYIVATKTFATPLPGRPGKSGTLKVSAGLGWGRLGSSGSIGSPFGARPAPIVGIGSGGTFSTDQWFRGPVAPFGGIEWTPNERWGLKLEYSSDAYAEDVRLGAFERNSSLNFGVEYQATERTRLGAYYLYGSTLGVTAQIQLGPNHPVTPMRVTAPLTIQPRPSRVSNPAAWSTEWTTNRDVPLQLRDILDPLLRQDGLVLETLDVAANTAELRYRNLRYRSRINATGRAARAMASIMPASVEQFRLIEVSGGMALSAVVVNRSDLERLEFNRDPATAIEARLGYQDAPPLTENAVYGEGLYPGYSWSLAPYVSQSYFDPEVPFRFDVGLELRGSYQPAPGWVIAGAIRQRIWGNIADGQRSGSALPPVRTGAVDYAQYGTTMPNLFAAYQWRPALDFYGRVTVGYLEPMFGGVSAELLWKPVNSRLGLGVEANWARQRDFDQRFGFQNYDVLTGHASAYYEFDNGFIGQVDVGRYLAGDVGATFTLDREFDNGWLVGGFFTLTDVSASDFGEGSFDKGIRIRIPVSWFLGTPSRQAAGTTIRPITRDGGARLSVPGRLYPQIRAAHRRALSAQKARFWN
ncbi:MAG: YjbH domain-containing protein [Paracoccaceae bacterium]